MSNYYPTTVGLLKHLNTKAHILLIKTYSVYKKKLYPLKFSYLQAIVLI